MVEERHPSTASLTFFSKLALLANHPAEYLVPGFATVQKVGFRASQLLLKVHFEPTACQARY